jgi:hypothetical protein
MSQTKLSPRLELLTSWKEIANFLGKGVRTVQRWEATLGLPVIRPADNRSGIVMARPSDLEAWLLNGRQRSLAKLHGQDRQDDGVHATFSECVRELKRYHAEVRTLCDQMNATKESLKQEIERLKFLYGEWDAIRGRSLGEEPAPASTKLN